MKRRHFLAATAAATPFALGAVPAGLSSRRLFDALGAVPSDRVLVLIQLAGGNDGLNTVVPLDQYDDLAAVRANVVLPRASLLGLDATTALHPAMAGAKALWDDGKLGIVRATGYPDQNRSHFRSTDIWQTASRADEVLTTGWVGRHLEREHPGFPNGYPNDAFTDPLAVTMGNVVNETCQGTAGTFGLTVRDPFNVTSILDSSAVFPADTPYGGELEYLRTSIAQTNAYSAVVRARAEAGASVAEYDEGEDFSRQLSNIARLISGGIRTKVFTVTLGGYDTHDSQVEPGATATGNHAALLKRLTDGIKSFQDDLDALGLADRVVGMTYSEFGRRIRSNAGFGTDHGTAVPTLLFGGCVNAGILGESPEIDRAVDEFEGVPMQYDFRDVYGSLLEDWFGLAPATVREIVHEGYVKLPILRDCAGPGDNDEPGDGGGDGDGDGDGGGGGGGDENPGDGGQTSGTDSAAAAKSTRLTAAPSAFRDAVRLTFATDAPGTVRLSAYGVDGRLIETLFERRLPAGERSVNVDTADYPAGVVVFRLQRGASVGVLRTVKL